MVAVQVATTATFSACALEALRMLLADLEQPGGTLTTPIKAPMALLLPVALALFPIMVPAGLLGKTCMRSCRGCLPSAVTSLETGSISRACRRAVLGTLQDCYTCKAQ